MEDKIKIVTTNRKAHHDYEILETIEAGIVLKGTIKDGEVWLLNMHISPYEY